MFIDETFNNRTVCLVRGDVLDIRLEEKRTTGFRWIIVSDGAPTCIVIDNGFSIQSSAPGASGTRALRVEATRTGVCEVELRYRRSWLAPEDSDPAFKLHVQVASTT